MNTFAYSVRQSGQVSVLEELRVTTVGRLPEASDNDRFSGVVDIDVGSWWQLNGFDGARERN